MADAEPCFVPFHAQTTSDKLQEIARKELGETEELKKECLQQLKRLIADHNVHCISTDDFLLRFLRTKKFDVKRSFEALRNYVRQRTLLHKHLQELPLEVVETCIRRNILGMFPYRDSQDRIIYFFKPANWNPSMFSVHELLTTALLLADYLAEKESSQITGIIPIVDMTSVPLTYSFYVIQVLKRWKDFVFNCLPLRYNSFHFISNSVFVKFATQVVFPVVPKKLRERVIFHEECEDTFKEYFPLSILPDIYGGTCGSVNPDQQIKIFLNHLKKMKDEIHYFQN